MPEGVYKFSRQVNMLRPFSSLCIICAFHHPSYLIFHRFFRATNVDRILNVLHIIFRSVGEEIDVVERNIYQHTSTLSILIQGIALVNLLILLEVHSI